ncbi:hypothetical protein H9L39_15116 [Fusarium oxysporum f. sp. albedinis]|nr:hypothetical protein H9L39_15116 [Fusarium oxysporum f. sp. albedinis]
MSPLSTGPKFPNKYTHLLATVVVGGRGSNLVLIIRKALSPYNSPDLLLIVIFPGLQVRCHEEIP